jgi:hypothetical protein
MAEITAYRTFREFCPFCLGQHQNRTSKRLHFIGTSLAVLLIIAFVFSGNWGFLLAALVQAHAFAWAGHFFFESNRPATFQYPVFSFMADWCLWWETIAGKVRF